MVTNTEGYVHIIEYLTEHLNLFENSAIEQGTESVIEVIEQELSEQIISVCGQNDTLTFNQRNTVIREVDAILYDLEEILSGVLNNPITAEQKAFIIEWASLVKNLFDTEIHQLLSS